jgi:hypothetical protein
VHSGSGREMKTKRKVQREAGKKSLREIQAERHVILGDEKE